MCGIFGFYSLSKNQQAKTKEFTFSVFNSLAKEANSRGKEASGFALIEQDNTISYIKSDESVLKLIQSSQFSKMKDVFMKQDVLSGMGHSRLVTHGSQLNHQNNQPVISQNGYIIGVHNGIVTNHASLWKAIKNKKSKSPPELDTQSLFDFYENSLIENNSTPEGLIKSFDAIEGSASVAIYQPEKQLLTLSTNTGSLYWTLLKTEKTVIFASEKIFLLNVLKNQKNMIIHQVKPLTSVLISPTKISLLNHQTKAEKSFTLDKKTTLKRKIKSNFVTFHDLSKKEQNSEVSSHYSTKNSLKSLKKHDFDYKSIYALKRCTKCILPSTTPFIHFDIAGVCNFCHEHTKIQTKGAEPLEEIIKKYRKGTGEPDCLAAFSGGRDSSYGLHFLKKELGLQPLAYTYDWGMVTDIARENQARILGKLGVEHILISADITKKRQHIKQNILAWLKNPHLGMVPLFMQGDKQCEFYADQIMNKYNLNLMFFFRGNELEKEEFKTGHCGVKDADPGGVIHHLAPLKKVQLLSFYASQYLLNPAYFNSSFLDTSLAFFTTYIQPHNYLYLWHYVPWIEEEIISTLKNEYNWQTSDETDATWRTDDGSSAFYNYIYYQVQGFTENDSFRARQIREGLLTREEALEMVHLENKPRYKALKWYFDMVGLDGDYVLGVVDSIKKLY